MAEDGPFVWRWRTTRYGPLAKALQHRMGERCDVFVRGADGKVGVVFADGYRVVALRWAIRRAAPPPGG